MHGDECRTDNECAEELNLVCTRNELRTCNCRKGYVWNALNKICHRIKEYPYDSGMQRRASFSLKTFKIPTYFLLEKLTGSQLVKKFRAFYGTQKLITAFTTTRHLCVLSQINLVHTPHLQI
jgi:hypothetical protein